MTPLDTLLADAATFVRRFVRLPVHADDALVLWMAHAWAIDGAHATLYFYIDSPEPRCGKTRTLEVSAALLPDPLPAVSATEAALFRSLASGHCTLLLDELDALFAGSSERAEPIRALLNAGNRRGTSIPRCVGPTHEVQRFDVFGPKILAGISGKLPQTLRDRSLRVSMRRKLPGETVERWLPHRHGDEIDALRGRLEQWAADATATLIDAEPTLPAELDDRAAEGWEPLLAIADMAGGDWPARARAAALALSADGEVADEASLGMKLLAALRDHWPADADVMSSASLLEAINGDDETPFGGFRDGAGLNARGMAKMLKGYGARPRTVRLADGSTPKGYARGDLTDAWSRYLPGPVGDASIRHNATTPVNTGDSADPNPPQDPRCGGSENAEIPREHCDVADVADRNRGDGANGVNGDGPEVDQDTLARLQRIAEEAES